MKKLRADYFVVRLAAKYSCWEITHQTSRGYGSLLEAVFIEELDLVPRVLIATDATMATKPTSNTYSTRVAPSSLRTSFEANILMLETMIR